MRTLLITLILSLGAAAQATRYVCPQGTFETSTVPHVCEPELVPAPDSPLIYIWAQGSCPVNYWAVEIPEDAEGDLVFCATAVKWIPNPKLKHKTRKNWKRFVSDGLDAANGIRR